MCIWRPRFRKAYITNGTRTINMMLIALAAVLVVVSVFLTLPCLPQRHAPH